MHRPPACEILCQ